jgi:hypothetical protein
MYVYVGVFIIENTVFTGNSMLESQHHCNIGTTGVLCMNMYVFSNVTWKSSGPWVQFHTVANHFGGIFVLAPSDVIANEQSRNGLFPAGFQSFVFNNHPYLLDFGSDICQHTYNMTNAFPNITGAYLTTKFIPDDGTTFPKGAIFCKKPLRSLRIYTSGLDKSNSYTDNVNGKIYYYTKAFDLTVSVYENKLGGKLITTFVVPFHQAGDQGRLTYPNKQVSDNTH